MLQLVIKERENAFQYILTILLAALVARPTLMNATRQSMGATA